MGSRHTSLNIEMEKTNVKKIIRLNVLLVFVVLLVQIISIQAVVGQEKTSKVIVNGVEDTTLTIKHIESFEEFKKWLLEESGFSKESIDLIIKMEEELEKAREKKVSKEELAAIVRKYQGKTEPENSFQAQSGLPLIVIDAVSTSYVWAFFRVNQGEFGSYFNDGNQWIATNGNCTTDTCSIYHQEAGYNKYWLYHYASGYSPRDHIAGVQ